MIRLLLAIALLSPSLAFAVNLIEQRLDENGIYLKASNGKTVTITKQDLMLNNAVQLGTKDQKKTQTEDWVVQKIIAALGEDMVSADDVSFLMDENATPVTLEVGEPTAEKTVAKTVEASNLWMLPTAIAAAGVVWGIRHLRA